MNARAWTERLEITARPTRANGTFRTSGRIKFSSFKGRRLRVRMVRRPNNRKRRFLFFFFSGFYRFHDDVSVFKFFFFFFRRGTIVIPIFPHNPPRTRVIGPIPIVRSIFRNVAYFRNHDRVVTKNVFIYFSFGSNSGGYRENLLRISRTVGTGEERGSKAVKLSNRFRAKHIRF